MKEENVYCLEERTGAKFLLKRIQIFFKCNLHPNESGACHQTRSQDDEHAQRVAHGAALS